MCFMCSILISPGTALTMARCTFYLCILIHIISLTSHAETITDPGTTPITCQGGEDCDIICHSTCRDAVIICPTGYQCSLSCGIGSGACRQATVHAALSTRFEIKDCGSGNKFTCTGMTIYWPPNDNGIPRGFLNVSDNFNAVSAPILFYAEYGWNDIDTTVYQGTYAQTHEGTMFCTSGYTSSCAFETNAWTCLASGDLTCADPPTPPPTTAAPTAPTTAIPTRTPTIPTSNPSIATSNPSIATPSPTYVTSNPSAAPTFTVNPTVSPTSATANPTTVSIGNTITSANIVTSTLSATVSIGNTITSANPTTLSATSITQVQSTIIPTSNPVSAMDPTTATTTALGDIETTAEAMTGEQISEDSTSSSASGIVIGAVSCVLVLVAMIAGISGYFWWKKRKLNNLETIFGSQDVHELDIETPQEPANTANMPVAPVINIGVEPEKLESNPVHLQRTWKPTATLAYTEDVALPSSNVAPEPVYDHHDAPPPPPSINQPMVNVQQQMLNAECQVVIPTPDTPPGDAFPHDIDPNFVGLFPHPVHQEVLSAECHVSAPNRTQNPMFPTNIVVGRTAYVQQSPQDMGAPMQGDADTQEESSDLSDYSGSDD